MRHHNLRTLILRNQLRHLSLGRGIERTSRLIQHQNPWIPQQSGHNRDALALTAREILAAARHDRVEAHRQILHKIQDAHRENTLLNFFTAAPVIQPRREVIVETSRPGLQLLRHIPNMGTQLVQRIIFNIDSAHTNRARNRAVQRTQQLSQGTLART